LLHDCVAITCRVTWVLLAAGGREKAVARLKGLRVLFRVSGLGFWIWGLWFRLRVWSPGFRVQCSGFRVQGAGFRFQGSKFWV